MAWIEDRWYTRDGKPSARCNEGKRWKVGWREGDRKRSESFATKEAAKQRARTIEREQESGGSAPTRREIAAVTFAYLYEAFERDPVSVRDPSQLPRESYLASLLPMMRYVANHFGQTPVSQVCASQLLWTSTVTHLREAFLARHEREITSSTINRYMYAQRTLVQYGKLKGILPPSTSIPVWMATEKADRQRRLGKRKALTSEELSAILAAAPVPERGGRYALPPNYWRLFLEVSMVTGARLGEVLGLTVDDLNTNESTLTFSKQADRNSRGFAPLKTEHSARTIPISRDLTDALVRHLAATSVVRTRTELQLVFPNARGGLHTRANIRKRVWLPALERAGVPQVRFHDLRSAVISNMLASGLPGATVQEYVGHADLQTTLSHYSLPPGGDLSSRILNAVNVPQRREAS